MNCECQSLPAVADVAGTARVLPTSGAMVLLRVVSSMVHRQQPPRPASVNASPAHPQHTKEKRKRKRERGKNPMCSPARTTSPRRHRCEAGPAAPYRPAGARGIRPPQDAAQKRKRRKKRNLQAGRRHPPAVTRPLDQPGPAGPAPAERFSSACGAPPTDATAAATDASALTWRGRGCVARPESLRSRARHTHIP